MRSSGIANPGCNTKQNTHFLLRIEFLPVGSRIRVWHLRFASVAFSWRRMRRRGHSTNTDSLAMFAVGKSERSFSGSIPKRADSLRMGRVDPSNLFRLAVRLRRREGRMDLRRSRWSLGMVLTTFALVGVLAGADEPNFTEEQWSRFRPIIQSGLK